MSREEENSTLYVVGVPECADENRIKEEFGKYGNVEIVTVLAKRDQYKTHTVFVKFSTFEEAKKAKNMLNCTNPFDNGPTMTVKIADKDHKRKPKDEEKRKDDRDWDRERRRNRSRSRERRSDSFSKRDSNNRFDNRRNEYEGYDKFIKERENRDRYPPYDYVSVPPSYNYSLPPSYSSYVPPISTSIVSPPRSYSDYSANASFQQAPPFYQPTTITPPQYNYNPYKK